MANSVATGVAYADPAFTSVQIGSSSVPITISSSGVLNGAYASTSATSGDTRLSYNKLTFTSTGSGETLRAFSVVTGAGAAAAGTINGAHVTCSIDGSGTISGAANALRATLGGSSTNPGGTLAALQLDSDFASGGTWSNASFLRVTNSGTGEVGNFAVMPAVSATGVFRAKVGSPVVTHCIPVKSGSTTYYIMVSTVA
jgi:hypothetical protein|tara:strand:- start:169 stop:765 length:597 start_codon:yes stop_codon:yes gene_type:complete